MDRRDFLKIAAAAPAAAALPISIPEPSPLPPKKKLRWSFWGATRDCEEGIPLEIVFPEIFVRINDRPRFPYMAVAPSYPHVNHQESTCYLPGSITISQDFPEKDFERWNWRAEDVTRAFLRLWSAGPGWGCLLEEWSFHGVKMGLNYYYDEYASWWVQYEESKWKQIHNLYPDCFSHLIP